MQKKQVLRSKNFFLSYPNCDCTKEEAMSNIKEKWEIQLDSAVVCEEPHKNGEPHLHVTLSFKDQKRFRFEQFDFICMKRGNNEVTRNPIGAIKYVIKEGNYLQFGIDVEAKIKSQNTKKGVAFETVAKSIRQGKRIDEIDDEYPGFVLQNLDKMKKYKHFRETLQIDNKLGWYGCEEPSPDIDLINNKISCWLNKNIGKKRKVRQKMLFIYG